MWTHGKASIREIQGSFPEPCPAYTTIQTTVYRIEGKKVARRVRKIRNAHIFEPTIAREVARRRLLDEILSLFGGRAQPMMAQLAESLQRRRDVGVFSALRNVGQSSNLARPDRDRAPKWPSRALPREDGNSPIRPAL